jgi:hypothetical protein
MTYFLFVDESGHDARSSPYEVLAGAAVHDTQIWDLICDIHDAEVEVFGRRISHNRNELKAKMLLKRKTFRLAAEGPAFEVGQRTDLVRELLDSPDRPSRERLIALGQAKIAFAEHVLELCATHGVRFFASIIDASAPRPEREVLRKDYAYLFERFFYYVDAQQAHERGIVVFDELERSQAHVLVGQMASYFRNTATGRFRSGRIIPEPFFVHSELTTGVQIADLVAYIIVWNVRVGRMGARAPAPSVDGTQRLSRRVPGLELRGD